MLRADREDRHDIGVVQMGDRLSLAAESLDGILVGHGPESQHLQRHSPAERTLLRLVDHPHPAAPQFADDVEVAQLRGAVRRTGGTVNELDPGQTGLKLRGQLGMLGQESCPIRRGARLQVRHVLVEHSNQFRSRVQGRRGLHRFGRRRDSGIASVGIGIGHGNPLFEQAAVSCTAFRSTTRSPHSKGRFRQRCHANNLVRKGERSKRLLPPRTALPSGQNLRV